MTLSLQEIAAATAGELQGEGVFERISTDSRSIQAGDLFVALQGPTFDGHDYIQQVTEQGAAGLLLHRAVDTALPTVLVADTTQALGQMGRFNRQRQAIPVVAVTGSNGKTTVKEMVAAILSTQGEVLKTQGNYNNDIGLPLTLLNIQAQHAYAVIEMGANHLQEIAYLSQLTQPNVAVITNAGDAHIEGFGSRDGVAQGKGEIFSGLQHEGVAVINQNDRYADVWRDLAKAHKIITFSLDEAADVTADASRIRVKFDASGFHTTFELQLGRQVYPVSLALAGQHNVMNALAAAAVAYALDIAPVNIVSGLQQMAPVAGRLQPSLGQCGARLINDTYNANPASLAVALDVLMQCQGEHWFILGDMGELGEDAQAVHADMGRLIQDKGVDRLWTVGTLTQATSAAFGEGACHFTDKQALIIALTSALNSGVVMLVKGSRLMRMEIVVQAMQASDGEVAAC